MVRLLMLGLCLFLAGCGTPGPELQPVKGRVLKGGEPLKGVSVTFSPVNPGPSSGGITDDEGKFVLLCQSGRAGAVVGKHKVVLTAATAANAGPVGMEAMMAARKASEGGGKRGELAKSKEAPSFSPEYGDAQKTSLSYEVKAGANDFDVVIP